MSEQHLDLDALADLLAAEGSPADEAHVARCAGCAGRLDELAGAEVEVAAVLAALPAPPVPDDLAARLQAAFDAEPPLSPSGPAGAAAGAAPADDGSSARPASATGRGGSATVTPFPSAGSRRRTWLPAAAAAVVLLGGAGVAVSALSGDSADERTTSAAGDAGGSAADPYADLPRSATGTDYATPGALDAALPAVLDGTASPLAATDDARAGSSGPVAPEAAVEAGSADPALDRLRSPDGLASCLTALLPPDDPELQPLAVDYAAYAGEPAMVVLLPAPGAPDRVDAFVVGADCAVGSDDTLLFTRLVRP